MISVSAKVLYQVKKKSEEMKIEKWPPYERDTGLDFITFLTPQFDAINKKDKIDE